MNANARYAVFRSTPRQDAEQITKEPLPQGLAALELFAWCYYYRETLKFAEQAHDDGSHTFHRRRGNGLIARLYVQEVKS